MSRTIVQTFPVIDTRVIEVEVPGIQGPKGPMGDLTPEAEAVRTEINQAKTDAQTAATQAAGSAEAAETSAENAEQAYQDTLTAKSDALSAIQEEANTQLGLIEDEGEEQTAAVQSEGTTAVTGVQIEAGKQIERIQKEGGLQVDRVEQTANDLLDRTTEEANKAADSAEAAEDSAQSAATILEHVQEEVASAMFSVRLCSTDLEPVGSAPLSSLTPTDNIKAGDTVIDPNGDVFQIFSLGETTFTVGVVLTNIIGPKGEQGDSFYPDYRGVLADRDQYDSYPKGTCFMDIETATLYFKLSDADKDWSEGFVLKGTKGDPGPSANEILMNPDPVAYFDQIYGKSHGDILGGLVVQPDPITPDPTEIFNSIVGR